jgi:uncharacterized protein involved in copper resistance
MRSLLRSTLLAASTIVACWGISGCSPDAEPEKGKMSGPMDTGKMTGPTDKMDTGKMDKMDTGKMSGPMDKMDTGKMDKMDTGKMKSEPH